MIATLIMTEGQPTVPLPHRALHELGLKPGQFVRIDIQPVHSTPRMESDGSYDLSSNVHF